MSVGADKLYFLGMPVPNETEAAFLAAERTTIAEASVDRLNPSYIFNRVHMRNSRIGQFIEFDYQEACNTEFDYLAHDKQDNFREGLWAGYEILVGSFEYMYFSRSRSLYGKSYDFEQYLSQMTPESDVSVILMSSDDIERLKSVRLGKVVIDISQKSDKASSTLAYVDSNGLFEQAPQFNIIMDEALARNTRYVATRSPRQETPAGSSAFIQGFYHGIAQAVEMYIQLQENHIVRKIGVFNQQ